MPGNGYRSLINSIATPVIVLNDQGEIQDANNPVLTLLGWNNTAGKSFKDIFGSTNQSTIKEFLKTVQSDPDGSVFEISLKHPSGLDINSHVKAMPVLDDQGKVSEIVLTFEDKKGIGQSRKTRVIDNTWLSDQGRYLISIDDWDDLIEHAGRGFTEICEPAVVMMLTNVSPSTLKLESAYGIGKSDFRKAWNIIGTNFLKDNYFEIEDRFKESYVKRRLVRHSGGLEEFAKNHVSPVISRQIAKTFQIGDIYTIGLEGDKKVLGVVYIFARENNQNLPTEIIESFAFQVALALEKIQYAKELTNSEQRFQMIFEHAPDAYYINDMQGRFITGNLAAEKLIGYKRDEIIGRNFVESGLLPKDQLPKAAKSQAKNLIGQPTGPDWFPLIRKDGNIVDVEISTHPVELNDQKVVLGIARDITERREAARGLEDAHQNLKHVLEGIDAHVYVADMETYEILYMNQAMIDDFGGDFTGKKCHKIFRGENDVCSDCSNPLIINSQGEPAEVHVWEGKNKITETWFRNYDRAIYWTDQRLARMQIAVDITDSKEQQKTLAQSEERYRNLFEKSHNAIMTVSPPDWKFTSGNSAMIDMFRLEGEDQLRELQPWELSPEYQPDGQISNEKARKMISIAVESGSNFFDWTHKRYDGEEFPATVQLTRVDLKEDFLIQATVRDISERVKADKLLSDQMEDLAIINELTSAANQGKSLQELLKIFSQAMTRVFGSSHSHTYIKRGEDLLEATYLPPEMDFQKTIEKTFGIKVPDKITIRMGDISVYKELLDQTEPKIFTDPKLLQGMMSEMLQSTLPGKFVSQGISKMVPQIFARGGTSSIAVFPILSSGKNVGIIDIVFPHTIDNIILKRIAAIADQLSGIIQRIQAQKERESSLNELEIINHLNVEANLGSTLDEILMSFTARIKGYLGAINAHVYLYDQASNILEVMHFSPNTEGQKVIESVLGVSIPDNASIDLDQSPNFNRLILKKEPGVIDQKEEIVGFLDETIRAVLGEIGVKVGLGKFGGTINRMMGIKNIAFVPLLSNNQLIGLVDIVSQRDFLESEIEWLKKISEQLSGIIQRVQAVKERQHSIKELEIINQAFVKGSRLEDIDEICNHLADTVLSVNPEAHVLVSLFDPTIQAIRLRAVKGIGKLYDRITRIAGLKPEEITIEIEEFGLDEDLKRIFTSGHLEKVPGGLHDLTRGKLPLRVCRAIERVAKIDQVYIAGFGLLGESTGGLIIALRNGQEIQFRGAIETIVNHYAEVFESRFAQEEILTRTQQLESLRSVELDISSKLELGDLLSSIAQEAADIVGAVSSGFSVYDPDHDHLVFYAYSGNDLLPDNKVIGIGEGLAGKVWETQETVIVEDYSKWNERLEEWAVVGEYYLAGFPVRWGDEPLGVLEIALPLGERLSVKNTAMLEMFATQAAIAIKNAQLYEAEMQKRQEAETLRELGMFMNSNLDKAELLDVILESLQKVVPYHSASIQFVRGGMCVIEAFRSEESVDGVIGKKFKISENKLAHPVLYEGKRLILDDVKDNDDWIRGEETHGIRSWLAVPLEVKSQRIGVLTLDHKNVAQYSERDASLAMNFANQAAIALENSRLLEEARQRLYRIESLRQIDLAISGSMDLEISMNVLVRQLITSLDVDAATVLIYNKTFNNLNFISGHGFTTESLKYTKLRIGEGLAGRAALEKEMVIVKDLAIQTTSLKRSPFLSKEKFVSYIAYPLVAKGQIVGVLEVFHRSRLEPDEEWIGFLGALAGQAAIAIDRINLFVDLENTNLDLTRAYDATIEGWAKAIELRDRETEGHSRRVVDLSIKLAMRLGISGEELLNIRRGALLHDIGKMAIPDGILLKPGKLTEDEWQVMKEHPVYAFQMLSPIEYLRDALDIPYLHHERWDGNGYPQGLKAEEIPLAARIFAVIDVWDALQSDRPYRKAWSEEKAIAYIKEMSGSHFDPTVAAEFLEMINGS